MPKRQSDSRLEALKALTGSRQTSQWTISSKFVINESRVFKDKRGYGHRPIVDRYFDRFFINILLQNFVYC